RQEELRSEGFEVSWRLAAGEPSEEILKVAEKERCDLIAMATHGHKYLDDLILGSVASTIRHRTDIPGVLGRARKGGGDWCVWQWDADVTAGAAGVRAGSAGREAGTCNQRSQAAV